MRKSKWIISPSFVVKINNKSSKPPSYHHTSPTPKKRWSKDDSCHWPPGVTSLSLLEGYIHVLLCGKSLISKRNIPPLWTNFHNQNTFMRHLTSHMTFEYIWLLCCIPKKHLWYNKFYPLNNPNDQKCFLQLTLFWNQSNLPPFSSRPWTMPKTTPPSSANALICASVHCSYFSAAIS